MKTKICTKCHKELPLDNYHAKTRFSDDGRQSHCKECHKNYNNRHLERIRMERVRRIASGESLQCSKCMEVKQVSKFSASGLHRKCPECMRCMNRRGKMGIVTRFNESRKRACMRGLPWTLTLEEFTALVNIGQCHYCSGPLTKTGVGLDRADNDLGYVQGNCVPCCGMCNSVKLDLFTFDEMLVLGAVIRDIMAKRNQHPMAA